MLGAVSGHDELEQAFRMFGLPRFMLSDAGPPFGSNGLGRLSRLGVWLVRIGVVPILIEPGRPDQNGRHERFHETLKAETASPPSGSIRAQQASFNRFQQSYNEERPHEALAMKTPAERGSGSLHPHDFLKALYVTPVALRQPPDLITNIAVLTNQSLEIGHGAHNGIQRVDSMDLHNPTHDMF